MRYPGGKGGAGVYQTIINSIPPHRVYIEAFAGGANIFERKAPAASSVLVDVDPEAVRRLRAAVTGRSDVTVIEESAFSFLKGYSWRGDEFVYLDPPYLHSTRKDVAIYRCELEEADHVRLLDLASSLPVPFALSGYRSALYDEAARCHGWRRIDFQAMTRHGVAIESLWMNYPAPAELADYAYAGQDFRDRERIRRKAKRWIRRFQQLPAVERGAILTMLQGAGVLLPAAPAGAAVVDVDHRQICRGSTGA